MRPRSPMDAEMRGPQRLSPLSIIAIVVLLFILVILMSSYYTINSDSVGVVQRFGRFHTITEPGLHAKLPLGIDRVTPVMIRRQMKEEFGFRTREAGVRSSFITHTEKPALLDESLMVTGDLNSAMVEWTIQYQIQDPRDYMFNVRHPEATLRDAAEAVMREVIGDHTVDEVLTTGRQDVADLARKKLQLLMENYKMGLTIKEVLLQDVKPPDPVEASFRDVNEAQQEREKSINEARAEYNKLVPRTKGEAQQKIQEAEGYALERVNKAQGDSTKFGAMLAAYRNAPDVTRHRIYLETMGQVIPKMGKKIIIDKESQQILPLLPLTTTEEAPKP